MTQKLIPRLYVRLLKWCAHFNAAKLWLWVARVLRLIQEFMFPFQSAFTNTDDVYTYEFQNKSWSRHIPGPREIEMHIVTIVMTRTWTTGRDGTFVVFCDNNNANKSSVYDSNDECVYV